MLGDCSTILIPWTLINVYRKRNLPWQNEKTGSWCSQMYGLRMAKGQIRKELVWRDAVKLSGWNLVRISIFQRRSITKHHDKKQWKKCSEETQTLRAGCSKAEPKFFAPPQTPLLGARDGQNLISWRWSPPLPTNPVWCGSMHAISSYRGNRPTSAHTHPQTDRTDYNTLRRS